jgi:hypothetical protein
VLYGDPVFWYNRGSVDEPEIGCSNCGGPVKPFGTMRHWFALDEGGALCLACARALAPERVEIAEAWEKRWNETPENPSE